MAEQEKEEEDVISKQRQASSSYRPPSGYRFAPTEVELVAYFLANEVARVKNFQCDPSPLIPSVDLYGPRSEPWRLCEEVAFPYRLSPTEFFCFATRKRHGNGDRCDRVVGIGTWSATGRDKKICNGGVVAGRRAFFSFKVRPPGAAATVPVKKSDMVTTHWVMYEYRLESPEFQTRVLCKIRNQKKEDATASGRWVTPWWEEFSPSSMGERDTPCGSEQADDRHMKKRSAPATTDRVAWGLAKKQKSILVVGGAAAAADPEEGCTSFDAERQTCDPTIEPRVCMGCPLHMAPVEAASIPPDGPDPLSPERSPGDIMFSFDELMDLGSEASNTSSSNAPSLPCHLDKEGMHENRTTQLPPTAPVESPPSEDTLSSWTQADHDFLNECLYGEHETDCSTDLTTAALEHSALTATDDILLGDCTFGAGKVRAGGLCSDTVNKDAGSMVRRPRSKEERPLSVAAADELGTVGSKGVGLDKETWSQMLRSSLEELYTELADFGQFEESLWSWSF